MGKKLSFKNSYAVSEVVGGIILVLIAVVAFSAIYTCLFPPAPDTKVSVMIEASVDSNGNVVLEHKGGIPLESYKVVVRYADNGTYIGSKKYNNDHWSIGERRYPLIDITGLKLVNESIKVWVGVYSILDDGTEKTVFEGVLHGRVESAQGESSDENPMLISSLKTNTVDEDLICYNYTIQPSINALTYIYNWEVNSNPITNLLMSFDTNSSDTVKDYSGNNNNGTIYGPTWVDYGRVGGAYLFDGVDDYISIPYCFENPYINEITVETWIKTTKDSEVIASFNKDEYWELSLKNGCVQWSTTANGNTIDLLGETTVNDNNWHYIAVSYDYSTGIGVIYVDGRIDEIEKCHDPGDALGSGDTPNGFIGKSNESTTMETWDLLTYDDFEDGFGNYTDGGYDCNLYTGGTFAHQGSNAANIEDNSGVASSFYHTNGIDVHTPGYISIKVDFWFRAESMEFREDFWLKYYDGSKWRKIADYDAEVDFVNGQFYHEIVWINETEYTFPTNMKIRFQCDASSDYDDVYIDQVYVNATTGAAEISNFSGIIDEFHIYNRALSSEQIYQNYLCSKDGLSDKSVIVSDETISGETWNCIVTPNDGTQDDIPVESNSLQIVEYTGGEQ